MILQQEADNCRRLASQFKGKPEARFLLQLASAFEDLAASTSMKAPGREATLE
jgi:hypothetical protein